MLAGLHHAPRHQTLLLLLLLQLQGNFTFTAELIVALIAFITSVWLSLYMGWAIHSLRLIPRFTNTLLACCGKQYEVRGRALSSCSAQKRRAVLGGWLVIQQSLWPWLPTTGAGYAVQAASSLNSGWQHGLMCFQGTSESGPVLLFCSVCLLPA